MMDSLRKFPIILQKKVADKLSGMCKTDRESYEKYWDDINPFIKFGCLKDEKFANKMNDYIIFKNLEGKYITLPDALKENEEKHKNTVFYVTDEKEQSQYINMFKKEGIDAVILKHNIDAPFITHLEQKNKDVKFLRIDAEVTDTLKEEVKEEDAETLKANSETLTEVFKKALNNDNLTRCQSRTSQRQFHRFHDDNIGRKQTYARNDENVRNGRYGSRNSRRNTRPKH